jgi:hypothetical protein
VPTFLIAFALVFVVVWGLRGLLNVVGASLGLQSALFQVFRILVVVGEALVLLGGLTLAVRPSALTAPRAEPPGQLRLAGAAIVVVGGLGTMASCLVFPAVALPLQELIWGLATVAVLLLIPAYLLLLWLVLRGRWPSAKGEAHSG